MNPALPGVNPIYIGLTPYTYICTYIYIGFKGAVQLLINRYGLIRFAQVPERISVSSSDGDHQ